MDTQQKKYTIRFGNGSGVTLELHTNDGKHWAHFYEKCYNAAEDLAAYFAGSNPEDWEGGVLNAAPPMVRKDWTAAGGVRTYRDCLPDALTQWSSEEEFLFYFNKFRRVIS